MGWFRYLNLLLLKNFFFSKIFQKNVKKRLNPLIWTRVDEENTRFINELYDPNLYKAGICCLNKN